MNILLCLSYVKYVSSASESTEVLMKTERSDLNYFLMASCRLLSADHYPITSHTAYESRGKSQKKLPTAIADL